MRMMSITAEAINAYLVKTVHRCDFFENFIDIFGYFGTIRRLN